MEASLMPEDVRRDFQRSSDFCSSAQGFHAIAGAAHWSGGADVKSMVRRGSLTPPKARSARRLPVRHAGRTLEGHVTRSRKGTARPVGGPSFCALIRRVGPSHSQEYSAAQGKILPRFMHMEVRAPQNSTMCARDTGAIPPCGQNVFVVRRVAMPVTWGSVVVRRCAQMGSKYPITRGKP